MNTSLLSPIGQSPARHDERAALRLRSFPRTDYQFQAHATEMAGARDPRGTASRADLRAFRALSGDYLAREAGVGYLIEAGVYALVASLSAWSLGYLVAALAQTARF